jgi:alkyl hydroperoxide reductase subunit AhpF
LTRRLPRVTVASERFWLPCAGFGPSVAGTPGGEMEVGSMSMIQPREMKIIRDHFDKHLKNPVSIDYFTQQEPVLSLPLQECMYCRETGELLKDLADLSPNLRLDVHDFVKDEGKAKELAITRIPGFVLHGAEKGRVRYFGIPSGYEFSSLIEDLVDVSRGTTDLSPRAREEIAAIGKDVHIQVFSTPT